MPKKSVEKTFTVNLTCSFCGKSQKDVRKLIAGPKVFICDECVKLCNDIIWTEIERATPSELTEAALDSVARAAQSVAYRAVDLKRAGAQPPDEQRANEVVAMIDSLDELFEALKNARVPWPTVAWKRRGLERPESQET
jgi:hypothetical protein